MTMFREELDLQEPDTQLHSADASQSFQKARSFPKEK